MLLTDIATLRCLIDDGDLESLPVLADALEDAGIYWGAPLRDMENHPQRGFSPTWFRMPNHRDAQVLDFGKGVLNYYIEQEAFDRLKGGVTGQMSDMRWYDSASEAYMDLAEAMYYSKK